MATLTIEGRKVNVDDSFFQLTPEQQDSTVEEISQALGITPGSGALPVADANTPVGAPTRPGMGMSPEDMQAGMAEMSAMTMGAAPQQNANPENTDDYIRAKMEATKMIGPRGQEGGMGQGVGDFIDRAMMDSVPFTDEIYSGTIGSIGRAMRDGTNWPESYKREQLLQNELSSRRYERSPVASTGGMLAGSLATGGALFKAGSAIPGMAKLGGYGRLAAFGGLQGAGQGEGTDRIKNAAVGAVTAPVVGALLNKGGQVVSKALAPKAAKTIPASERLASEAGGIYDAAYKSGTVITPQGVNKLINNMKLAAGRPNVNSRPQTFGLMDDLSSMQGKPLDIEAFHELRKQVNSAISSAAPEDLRTLSRMKSILDGSQKWMTGADVSNGKQGLELLSKANEIYARSAKTGKIETLIDIAGVKGAGKYTQSGDANAIVSEARSLYTSIAKKGSQGFNDAEIALIRKIASGETSGSMKRLVAKADPRGMISFGGGSTLGATMGGFLGGPVGSLVGAAAVPAAGKIAGKSVDKAAIAAIHQLEEMVASGKASPAMKKAAAKMLGYTPGVALTTAKLVQSGIEQRR